VFYVEELFAKSQRFPKHIRLPITVVIMEYIYSILKGAPMAYNSIMFLAACCTAFSGFLRVNDLTAPSFTQNDPEAHLSLADVPLDHHHSPSKIWLFIKQSRTKKGATFCMLVNIPH